jgi:hypothetical protein
MYAVLDNKHKTTSKEDVWRKREREREAGQIEARKFNVRLLLVFFLLRATKQKDKKDEKMSVCFSSSKSSTKKNNTSKRNSPNSFTKKTE